MIDLDHFQEKCYEVSKKREQNGASIKVNSEGILKHCATEVIEAMQAYTEMECYRRSLKPGASDLGSLDSYVTRYEDELADIIVCALIAAECSGLEMEPAIRRCYRKNRNRADHKGDKL